MAYDKMNEYVESVFNIFKMVKSISEEQKDKKMQMIALLIYKYVNKLAKDNNVDLKSIPDNETINLIAFFEYISHNNIELYDFSNIKLADVDTNNTSDLERFVLTHIYYITQRK
jgi:hypothetical protein